MLTRSTRAFRKHLTRLPEAGGETSGVTEAPGAGSPEPALRMAVVGDSVAAGVGAPVLREALPGELAAALTAITGRAVSWRVSARSGATLCSLRKHLLSGLTDPMTRWTPDLVVVMAGTNDAMRLRSPWALRREAQRLVRDIRLRLGPDVPVVFAGLPDLRDVDVLPRSVRGPLRLYVTLLDRQLRVVARRGRRVHHLHSGGMPEFPGPWMSSDRFHPSAQGYRAWARVLAGRLSTLTDPPAPPAPPTDGAGPIRIRACAAGGGRAASPWRP
ncbi:SGNH/GDSL hydrolase family protein [Streptomyces sp. NPDC059816]|uniref:SGNH/GDSL hydrolase family protein n=1 Tax=Streptomyces sp. NPDC059816 TaxID=3346960 RepID=UPI0036573734